MPQSLYYDPAQVAYYEKAGWEAYYDRNWTRAFWLLVQLNRALFGMPWFTAVSAALDTVRASRIFAPVDHDVPAAQAYLARFYAKARRYAGIQTDAETLARLEMDYWIVHRELAIRRQQNPADDDLTFLVDSLTKLHASLFASTPEIMRRSAELRAYAAEAVDRITGKRSTDVAADWRVVEDYLRQAYTAAQSATQMDAKST